MNPGQFNICDYTHTVQGGIHFTVYYIISYRHIHRCMHKSHFIVLICNCVCMLKTFTFQGSFQCLLSQDTTPVKQNHTMSQIQQRQVNNHLPQCLCQREELHPATTTVCVCVRALARARACVCVRVREDGVFFCVCMSVCACLCS